MRIQKSKKTSINFKYNILSKENNAISFLKTINFPHNLPLIHNICNERTMQRYARMHSRNQQRVFGSYRCITHSFRPEVAEHRRRRHRVCQR